jgi:PKD repeat protein
MRTVLTALLALGLLLPCVATAQIADVDPARNMDVPSFLGYVPDRFIVVLRDDVGVDHDRDARSRIALSAVSGFDELARKYNVEGLKPQFPGADRRGATALARHYKVSLPAGNLDAAMAEYAALPQVERVEKIGIHALYATPNDGYYDPYQWYHNQTNDDDIDSPEAWDIQTGSSNVVLAILDSGTRYYHPDLGGVNASPSNVGASRGNMWINDAELNGSPGVDDDGNGYVDDWVGYDFIETTSNCWPGEDCDTQDNDPRDFNGHGTHCAGIVGMLTNDGYGMAGVAGGWGNGSQAEYGNGVRVMALRIGFSYDHFLYGEVGVVYMDAAAEAFYYAADNGATIASCSWGSSNSGGIGAAADYFIANGGLIFTAAGNDGSETPSYLGGRNDVIAVAATDENDAAASFTTYGTWVDISAPGVGIYSTYHDHADPNTNYWASMDGTSMACPMAAATAAMIWSQNLSWSAAQVESQLYSSAENIDAELSSTYIGKMGAGRINLYNAVNTGPPPPPVAAFVGSPTSGIEPLTVDFTDQSTGIIDSWSWDFGDGVGTSNAQNPSYTYNTAGTYTVSLTVTNTGGSDNDTKVDYITVNPCVAPVAGFVGSPTSGDYPLTVNFTDQSTGAASYSWDFGDGVGTSAEASPSYTYTAAGVYTVTQTVTNACGSDQLVRTDYITVTEPPPPPPTADFAGSPTSGDNPLTVNFTDQSTDGPTSWSWDFGDGVGTSTLQNPSYTYTAAGTYTVSLTATNAYGSDVETKTDYITVTEPGQNEKAYAGSEVTTYGTVNGDYTRTHISDGVYEVLTEALSTGHPVKTTSELEHRWTLNVSSGSNPTFYLEAYRTNNADGDDFLFAYSTDGAVYNNLVTVASATEQVYSVGLPAGTSGTVYIRVTDTERSWGNTSLDAVYVDEMYIEVETSPGPPVAEFTADNTSGYTPHTVNFTDLSTGSPTSWSWDFGDGVGSSTEKNPGYTYTSAGTYTVTLIATNAYGSDTEVKTDYINVTDPGVNSLHVNAINVSRKAAGPNNNGVATVTIYDQDNNPIANAVVYGFFNEPNTNAKTGTTDANGIAVINGDKTKATVADFCFEVTDVALNGYTYNSGDNVVTTACESGTQGAGPAILLTSEGGMPTTFELDNNPNPFNPVTSIRFALPEPVRVRIDIFNVNGKLVTTLLNEHRNEGFHAVEWNADGAASGIYFYRMTAGNQTLTRKMVLLK